MCTGLHDSIWELALDSIAKFNHDLDNFSTSIPSQLHARSSFCSGQLGRLTAKAKPNLPQQIALRRLLFRLSLPLPAGLRIILPKLNTNTIDTMPLIRGRIIPLPLEHMSQMATTITAHDLRPFHAERAVRMSRHCTWDAVEIRRPAAAGLEFVGRFVQRGVAGCAGVGAVCGRVFVVFACEGGFGAFFAEDAELLLGVC